MLLKSIVSVSNLCTDVGGTWKMCFCYFRNIIKEHKFSVGPKKRDMWCGYVISFFKGKMKDIICIFSIKMKLEK